MRLFAAVGIGAEMRDAAARVRRAVEMQLARVAGEPPRVVWVTPASLHVTLRFLGEQPDEALPGILEAVQTPFDLPPFEMTWRGMSAFPSTRRPRALWVGIDRGAKELGLVEAELARRFGGLFPGERPDLAPPFHPHLTLGRVKSDHAHVDWPAVLEAVAVVGLRSRVERVSLYRSRGLPGGAGYEEVGCGWLEGRR
jgi:2'-5' RNA ligase